MYDALHGYHFYMHDIQCFLKHFINRWNCLTEKGCDFIGVILTFLSIESPWTKIPKVSNHLSASLRTFPFVNNLFQGKIITVDSVILRYSRTLVLHLLGLVSSWGGWIHSVIMTQMFLLMYFIKACCNPLCSLLPLEIIFTGRRSGGSYSLCGFVMCEKPFSGCLEGRLGVSLGHLCTVINRLL